MNVELAEIKHYMLIGSIEDYARQWVKREREDTYTLSE
jgi:hypothetical protein